MPHGSVIKFLFCSALIFIVQYDCPDTSSDIMSLWAQTPNDTTEKKVYLEYADEVAGGEESYKIYGKFVTERIRSAIGNVRFRDETTVVECDTATEFLKSQKIHLVGNVVITRDTVVVKGHEGFYYPDRQYSILDSNVSLSDQNVLLKSKHGEYFSDSQIGRFSKEVSLKDKETVIYCDSLIYYRRLDHSIAIDHVKIVNEQDNMIITGGYGEHFNTLKHSFIEQQPILTQIESPLSPNPDTLIIKSLRMDAFRHPEDSLQRIVMNDSVRIWRASLTAKAKDAVYYLKQNHIVLTGDPLIWYDNSQVSGDSIIIRLKETTENKNQIDKIFIYDRAFLCSADSSSETKFDQLSGKNMIMTFNPDSKLERTDVYREARSLYHLYDKEAPSGANRSSGDEINILFKSNKVHRIKITGGVEGKQYPEWMLENRDLNLPNFNWRIEEKPKR